ncbi:MAG: hypothetical protein JXR88_06755 [Clostridia bacterium]|nr:hypothetical protein [Clostridia bacterium]
MKKIGILMILLFLVSCDHTDLSGDIIVSDRLWYVGDLIPLRLEVPEELEEIHDVMWGVYNLEHPDVALEILFTGETILNYIDENTLENLLNLNEIDYDRVVLFIPNESGHYRVEVEGFYKQTNPQPITELEITIE